jgi:L-fucose mutarotase
VCELLDAVLTLFPLDDFVPAPVSVMRMVDDPDAVPPVQAEIGRIVAVHEAKGAALIERIDRFDFYDRARKAYAIVSTTERKLYGCLILKKGVIRSDPA